MNVRTTFRTVDLANAVGISVQQVRNYEASGFIPAVERSLTGYRLYTQQHLDALKVTRLMIVGYGWAVAQQIMHAVHHDTLPEAFALIDERHAALARTREQLEQTLTALTILGTQLRAKHAGHASDRLRVGEAAQLVGVRVSALRFWEQQGLLHPVRDATSRYRMFDARQMRRLRIVALLRQANYDFDAIRATLDELEAGQPRRAVAAVEQRRREVAMMSWHCIEALASFHAYVHTFMGGVDSHVSASS